MYNLSTKLRNIYNSILNCPQKIFTRNIAEKDNQSWNWGDKGSISPTLLRAQIPKAQKIQWSCKSFFAFSGSFERNHVDEIDTMGRFPQNVYTKLLGAQIPKVQAWLHFCTLGSSLVKAVRKMFVVKSTQVIAKASRLSNKTITFSRKTLSTHS